MRADQWLARRRMFLNGAGGHDYTGEADVWLMEQPSRQEVSRLAQAQQIQVVDMDVLLDQVSSAYINGVIEFLRRVTPPPKHPVHKPTKRRGRPRAKWKLQMFGEE